MTFRNVTHLGFVSFGFSARRRRRHNAIVFSLWRLTKNETYTVETTRPPGVRRCFSSRLCFCFFPFKLSFRFALTCEKRTRPCGSSTTGLLWVHVADLRHTEIIHFVGGGGVGRFVQTRWAERDRQSNRNFGTRGISIRLTQTII